MQLSRCLVILTSMTPFLTCSSALRHSIIRQWFRCQLLICEYPHAGETIDQWRNGWRSPGGCCCLKYAATESHAPDVVGTSRLRHRNAVSKESTDRENTWQSTATMRWEWWFGLDVISNHQPSFQDGMRICGVAVLHKRFTAIRTSTKVQPWPTILGE
jgi:hypothetical protein